VHIADHVVVIRQATERDANAIDFIELASFIHPGERFSARNVRYLISSPRTHVIVAEANGQVVGWAAAFGQRWGKTPWWRVHGIAVDPKARGRGIGRRLLERMIDLLMERAPVRVFLEVRADNHDALRLYHRLGFVECAALPNFYAEGIAAIRMERVTASLPAASP
jgi:ribosomal-protein-alanine N-acetyltransferase